LSEDLKFTMNDVSDLHLDSINNDMYQKLILDVMNRKLEERLKKMPRVYGSISEDDPTHHFWNSERRPNHTHEALVINLRILD